MVRNIINTLMCILTIFLLCQCESRTPTMKINKIHDIKDDFFGKLNGKVKSIRWYDAEYHDGKVEKGALIFCYILDSLGNCTDQYGVSTDGIEIKHQYHAEFYPNGYLKSKEDLVDNQYACYKYNSKDNSVLISEYRDVNSIFRKLLISLSFISPYDTFIHKYDTQGNLIESSGHAFGDKEYKFYEKSIYDSKNRLVKSIFKRSNGYGSYYEDTISYKYTDNCKIVYNKNGIEIERYNEKGLLTIGYDEASGTKLTYRYVYDSNGFVVEEYEYKKKKTDLIIPSPPPGVHDSNDCQKKLESADDLLQSKVVKKNDEKGNPIEIIRYEYNDCEEVTNVFARVFEYDYYE